MFEVVGVVYDWIVVLGVLEILVVFFMVMMVVENEGVLYDGFVFLGVVICGEMIYYDIVVNELNCVIMDLIVDVDLVVGNVILMVENDE